MKCYRAGYSAPGNKVDSHAEPQVERTRLRTELLMASKAMTADYCHGTVLAVAHDSRPRYPNVSGIDAAKVLEIGPALVDAH